MKKLLTLCALLLGAVTSANAADSDPTYAQPASTIDVSATNSNLVTTLTSGTWLSRNDNLLNAYELTEEYLVFSAQSIARSTGNFNFIVQENASGNTGDAEWSASDPFKAHTYYYNSKTTTSVKLTADARMIAIKVTGCIGASVYAADKGVTINAWEINDDENRAYNTYTNVKTATTATASKNVSISGLDNSKTYVIQVVGSSNAGYTYGLALQRYQLPSPTITAAAASIIAAKSGVETTTDIEVNGTYLEGSNLTATLSPEVSGLSVTLASSTITEGTISTTATLHYTPSENASGSTTLTLSDGTTSKNVTITYKAIITPNAIKTVGQKTTWDWTSWNETLELKGDGSTTPTDTDEYTYSDIAAINSLTIPSGFDGEAIKFKGTYPVRSKKSQTGTWTIKAAFPGTLAVTFSDTGSGFDEGKSYEDYANRYLNINGSNTEYYTHRDGSTADSKEATVNIEAGEVVITGMGENGTSSQAIVVTKIVYTPSVEATYVDVSDKLYRTFASSSALDFTGGVEGLTAYAAIVEGDNVTFEPITGAVPAKTGMLLKAEAAGRYFIAKASGEPAEIKNAFTGVAGGTDTAEKGSFVLFDGEQGLGFYKTTAEEFTVGANTAYIPATVSAARTFIAVDGETTGVNAVESVEATDGKFFDLQGRQVSKPTKGLYISNGKKYIVK